MLSSFLFALEAVTPIFILVALGYALKRAGLAPQGFAKAANKLVFRVFLPCSLFLNVYRIPHFARINLSYVLYALAVVLPCYLVHWLAVAWFESATFHFERKLSGKE